MGHGLPDYYEGVDVAYQALAEMVVRPKYGNPNAAAGSGVWVAAVDAAWTTIAGKGMVYGGFIRLSHTDVTIDDDYVYLILDGNTLGKWSVVIRKDYGWDSPAKSALYLSYYDGSEYVISFRPEITFETSLVLWLKTDSTAWAWKYEIYYALI